jgi:predicted DNA-binding transcriptional regulator YafY
MPRSDRLFDMIQLLRDGRLHRATEIAQALGVSVRTIWRDMATLMASGMPIEGERGVGYVLRLPQTLPPLMLHSGEMDALRRGLHLVAEGDDQLLARAARGLAAKIAAVVPAPIGDDSNDAFSHQERTRASPHLPIIRAAIKARLVLTINYVDPQGTESHRDIRPLHLDLSQRIWTLTAWCDARRDFRSFRVDRIIGLAETGQHFAVEQGKRLKDYRARIATED